MYLDSHLPGLSARDFEDHQVSRTHDQDRQGKTEAKGAQLIVGRGPPPQDVFCHRHQRREEPNTRDDNDGFLAGDNIVISQRR